jgi:hypothetical protein
MANKYIDVSATYNGDGTASNQAASAGAAGAWNSLIAALIGTPGYGSLVAGDRVYVRTKNTGGTGNLSQNVTSTITGATTGTTLSPLNFVFDDGVIWAGDSGVFSLILNTSGILNFNRFANLLAKNYNLRIDATAYTYGSRVVIAMNGSVYREVQLDTYKTTSQCGGQVALGGSKEKTIIDNCKFNFGSAYSNTYPLFSLNQFEHVVFLGGTVDLLGASISVDWVTLFAAGGYGSRVDVYGLNVINTHQNHRLVSFQAAATGITQLNFYDCSFGIMSTTAFYASEVTVGNSAVDWALVNIAGNTDKPFDFVRDSPTGYQQWKEGDSYPTLNAQLPDGSNTNWSIKVFQRWARLQRSFTCLDICKLYTAAAATRTLTFEMLINADHWNGPGAGTEITPLDSEWWVEGTYINNADGLPICFTTKGTGNNLTTSTASWSSTSYGSQSYTKFKIVHTTANSIKPNTKIRARIMSNKFPGDTAAFYFIDPDFSVV